jgi:hypothetical protein
MIKAGAFAPALGLRAGRRPASVLQRQARARMGNRAPKAKLTRQGSKMSIARLNRSSSVILQHSGLYRELYETQYRRLADGHLHDADGDVEG